MRYRIFVIAAAAVVPMLTACVSTRQARDVKLSGFLGASASQLRKGRSGEEALLVYQKAGTHWESYDKIVVDPITIWSAASSTLPADQLADYQKLVNAFQIALTEKLSRSYAIINAAQPGALRIQVAIVNGSQANAVLKVAKTVAPYATFADVLWTFATGKPAFAGEVSIEYMIKDSETAELLAAGADRRVGGNQLGTSTFMRWGDVRNILTFWSDLAVYRLCVDRAGEDCHKPRAGLIEP